MKNVLLALSASFIMFSCTTQKTVNPPVSATATVENSEFFTAVNKVSEFEQVKINSTIKAETGAFTPPIDATIYIENGNKVWMNMAALFMNIARGVATPEGIKGYEKWNKTYIESDFSYLNNLLNVNFINYQAFQNLLVGRTFIPVNEKDFNLTKNAQGYTLSSVNNQKVTVDGKTSEYKVKMDYSPEFDLTNVQLQNISNSDQLDVIYSGWNIYENHRFPTNVKIIIKGQKNGQILLENTKFAFSKMETPYIVPENYTKKTIR